MICEFCKTSPRLVFRTHINTNTITRIQLSTNISSIKRHPSPPQPTPKPSSNPPPHHAYPPPHQATFFSPSHSIPSYTHSHFQSALSLTQHSSLDVPGMSKSSRSHSNRSDCSPPTR